MSCLTRLANAVKSGYPPAQVIPPSDDSPFLESFKRGEIVYIESSEPPAAAAPSSAAPVSVSMSESCAVARSNSNSNSNSIVSQGTFVVRKVPDDNSCLFHAVSGLLGGVHRSKVSDLRQIVADAVGSDSGTYGEAFLGRSNDEYRAWILSEAAWGGAIELGILARYFQVEIGAFDVQTMRLDRYGEGNDFKTVGYLIYSGIHYDYLALALGNTNTASKDTDVCQFDPSDTEALLGAKELCNTAHVGRQWTNTQTFTIMCDVCKTRIKGEKEALEHSQATGHMNFSELRD